MEIDTGFSLSLISKATYDKLQSSATLLPLKSEQIKLHTYIGEDRCVRISFIDSPEWNLYLHLTPAGGGGDAPSLIGQNWLTKLCLDWRSVHAISLSHSLKGTLEQNKEIFQQGLGKIKGIEVNLHVDTQAKLLYFKAPSVQFALKQKVEQGSERLESQDVIAPVPFSEWARPIIPIVKNGSTVYVCGDYKLTAKYWKLTCIQYQK